MQLGVDLLGSAGWTFCVDAETKTMRVAAGSHDGTIRVWDAGTGKLTATFFASPGFVAPPDFTAPPEK